MKHLFTRSMRTIPSSYDAKTHTVKATVSSETPVAVIDWDRWEIVDEILLADGMSVPDNGQVPLLDSHDRSSVESILGSGRNFAKDGGLQTCDVLFSAADDGAEAELKVREGHLTDFSAGYNPTESTYIPEGQKQSINGREYAGPVKVTTKWNLRELSLVPIGADALAKVRSLKLTQQQREILVGKGMPATATDQEAIEFLKRELIKPPSTPNTERAIPMPPEVAPAVPATPTREDGVREERERVADINALVTQFKDNTPAGMRELADKAIKEGMAVDAFQRACLEQLAKAKPVERMDPNIGLGPKDLKRYSILRAISSIASGKVLDGLEREASDAVAKLMKREAKGFFIPNDVIAEERAQNITPDMFARAITLLASQRALNVTTSGSGGYLVGTNVLIGSMIELLRNAALLTQLGITQLTGLTGNIAIPRVTGGATAYWLPETGTVTESDQAFSQLGLSPHRLVGDTAYTKELIGQTSLDVEAFVRQDLMAVLAIALDLAGIAGTGADGQPKGILNTTGIGSVTFGATATWAKVVSFETALATANVRRGDRKWLTTPGAKGKWKVTPQVSNYPVYLWNGQGDLVNGYPAYDTNQVPSDRAIFGVWSELIMALFAGVDVVVDPYSLKKQGQVEVTTTMWGDFGLRHPVSFVASTDSAAQ